MKRVTLNLGLDQWFSTSGDFAPMVHLAVSGDISDCHTWDGAIALGILWVEPRDAAEHHAVLRIATHTKNYLAPNV